MLLAVPISLLLVLSPLAASVLDNSFSHNVDYQLDDNGERLKLHSSGVLSDVIDLDVLPGIKRLVCVEDKILLVTNQTNVATDWKEGQLLLGSPRWRCNATNDSDGGGIYAKITGVYFPTEKRVAVHVIPAGPYDMIQEAIIHFRYSPGTGSTSAADRARSRRSLSNILTRILGSLDWHANFTTTIPFNEQHSDASAASRLFSLHKTLGDKTLTMTDASSEDDLSGQKDDFMLRCISCHGRAHMSYVFELLIKKVNNEPQLLKYTSQLEAESHLLTDVEAEFSQEMGVNYSRPLWQSGPTPLISIPVAVVRGLPPVELTLSYNTQALASVFGYTGGKALVRNGFVSTGKYTMSQTFTASSKMTGDITSYDWTTQGQDVTRTEVTSPLNFTVDIYQKIFFNASISWKAKDILINLSPPMEITLRPSVKMESEVVGFAECVSTTMDLDGQFKVAKSELNVDAFGISIWDVVLNPKIEKKETVMVSALSSVCRANCDAPSELGPPRSAADVVGGMRSRIVRGSQEFEGLRVLQGGVMQFASEEEGFSWCGAPGQPCPPCDSASVSDINLACADRIVSSRMAPAITKLAHLVQEEWSNVILMILEGWDEPSSSFPLGQHGNTSLHYEGRAAIATLTYTNGSNVIDSVTLQRLGSLAVCSGFEYVGLDHGDSTVHVAVKADGSEFDDIDTDAIAESMFRDIIEEKDIDPNVLTCKGAAPVLAVGDTVPSGMKAESVVGPPQGTLSRINRNDIARLYHYGWNDVHFLPEQSPESWCGVPTRPCQTDCSQQSNVTEAWDWCDTRIMSRRMALKLKQLAKVAALENIEVHVQRAFTESGFAVSSTSDGLYNEGRGLTITTKSPGDIPRLAVLAACSGFDFTSYTDPSFIEVFVRSQGGTLGTRIEYVDEESTRLAVDSPPSYDEEYSYPQPLLEETILPPLADGNDDDTYLSEHFLISDITSPNRRYFRFDSSLLLCLDMISDDLGSKVEILPGSAYRSQSVNMINFDIRHSEERYRFISGQSVEIRQRYFRGETDLFILAKSIFRSCTSFLREQMRGVGVGCHEDRLYLDVRPLEVGREMDYITVWDTGNNQYCQEVADIQQELLVGGPAVVPFDEAICSYRPLGDRTYLTFQFQQKGICSTTEQAAFCAATKSFRVEESRKLQERMTSAAGFGRLPRADIHRDLDKCIVSLCGGCPGAGILWDQKVKACSVVVDKFISRATRAFPDLTDRATFFNTETADSTVHSLSCHDGNICVENIQLYSLLMPLMTSRYRPDPTGSIEILMFSTEKNPSPLLELVEQEMAYRAKGKVKVFVEAKADIKDLKGVLKVLMVYNKNVTDIEFHVADDLDVDLVTSDLQRNIDVWAGSTCPDHSRFAIAPFSFHTVSHARRRRSLARSEHRNEARRKVLHWEMDWLMKML